MIVVDDGSTDDTRAVMKDIAAERWAKKRLLWITLGRHAGLAYALNEGIRHSRYGCPPLIARLDADDQMAPTRLEEQVRYLSEHPEVGLLGTAAVITDADGLALDWEYPPTDDASICASLPRRNPMFHSSWMFRREVYDRIGGYDPSFEVAQDYDFLVRAAEVTKLANLPDALTIRRQHPEQVSARRAKARRLAEARIRWRQGNVLGAVRARVAAVLG